MGHETLHITIERGTTKAGDPEAIERLDLSPGEVVAIIGPTGSGKSQLLSDIEQRAQGDTPTQRRTSLTGGGDNSHSGLVAQLSQSMRFVIDMPVSEFLEVHADSLGRDLAVVRQVIDLANQLTGEPISPSAPMTTLSGGQSRALMIADIARISRAPVVLIDEIENAGIDKLRALETLAEEGKIVLIASHDPVVILLAQRRVVMKNGGMTRILETSPGERDLLDQLMETDREISRVRESLRHGETVTRQETQ
jgi:ABC-type lipoprotein export system ATPase subunit